ncbi:MAG: lipopolysaccharide biosynthesis protein [Vitreoscilla sp.]
MRTLLARLETKFRLLTFAGAMLPTMGALALQFVTFTVTARGLGVQQFGRYAAVLALAAIGVELVGLGGADLLVRGTARNPASFARYYGNMLLLIAGTLPWVVLAGMAVAVGPMQMHMALAALAAALAAEIASARMSTSLESVMVAHGHTVAAGWVRMASVLTRLGAAVLFFVVFGGRDLDRWIAVVVVQSALLCVACLVVGSRLYARPLWTLVRDEMSTGAAFCVGQVARSSQSNMDRVVLARFADEAALGAYGAASRVLQLGLFPMQVVTRILYPKFFIHGANGLRASRHFALRTAAPALLAVGVLSCLALLLVARFVPAVLGKDFAQSSGTTMLLSLALPLIALQYPAADALTGAGRQALRAGIYAAASVGFGLLLAAGALWDGVLGTTLAFIGGHGLLAAILWSATFVCRDARPVSAAPPAPPLGAGQRA